MFLVADVVQSDDEGDEITPIVFAFVDVEEEGIGHREGLAGDRADFLSLDQDVIIAPGTALFDVDRAEARGDARFVAEGEEAA